MSVCHFDVRSFISKMYMTVFSTSNWWNSSQSFWETVSWVIILSLARIKFPFFLIWWLIEFSSASVRVNHNFCQTTLTTLWLVLYKPLTLSLPQNTLVLPEPVYPKLKFLRPPNKPLCSLQPQYWLLLNMIEEDLGNSWVRGRMEGNVTVDLCPSFKNKDTVTPLQALQKPVFFF